MVIRSEEVKPEENGGFTRRHCIDASAGAGSVSMGTVTLQPGCSLQPHYHLVEDAMIVIEGIGEFVLEGEAVTVTKGDALLAPAGKQHFIRNTGSEPFTVVYTWPSVNGKKY